MTDETETDRLDAQSVTTEERTPPRDPLGDDFQLGDPCIDLATGRTVTVVGLPGKTVAEWSGDNDYDLTDNYANERTRVSPNDPVIEAAYTSSVQSEPNGPRGSDEGAYTFPSSRLARVTIESIDGVDRVYDAIARDVLTQMLKSVASDGARSNITAAAREALDAETVTLARELADVEQKFGSDGANDPSSGGGFET